MSIPKIQLLLAAILATGAIIHHFRIHDEISSKEELLSSLSVSKLNEDRVRARSSEGGSRGAMSSTSSHIDRLLKLAKGPLSIESFDPDHEMSWTEEHLALANHREEEVKEFLNAIESPPFPKRLLSSLQSLASRLFPRKADFGTQIEEALAKDGITRSSHRVFQKWLASDPQAATKWLDTQLEANVLEGKGIDKNPLELLTRVLVLARFPKSPADIAPYYDRLSETGKLNTRMMIAQQLAQGDEKQIEEFLSKVSDEKIRKSVLEGLVSSKARAKASKDDILSLTENLTLSADERQQTLNEILNAANFFEGEDLSSRIDWIKKTSGQADFSPYLNSLVSGAFRDHSAELEAWAETENDPQIKQDLYQALSTKTLYEMRDLKKASEYFAQIQDPAIQKNIFQDFQRLGGELDEKEFNEHLTAAGIDPSSLKK